VSSDRQYKSETDLSKKIIPDVSPGKFKAKLILSDGREVILDSTQNGILAKQGATEIRSEEGKLVYKSNAKNNEVLFNTLSTSKGETFSTVLEDGSRIWLNSSSSVRYPVAFTGNERKIEITGEAYFEIAHDASKPFKVMAGGMETEVLGTRFNINSYRDETMIRTTLLEGSVKITPSGNGAPTILKPGQQAVLKINDSHLATDLAINDLPNLEAVMAWKEGQFYFDNADITTVMHQLEKWYNIEVVYQGNKPPQLFGGKIQRNLNLSQVLRALEYTGINFRIEGRKLIVMP
jgi:hypothetical protein